MEPNTEDLIVQNPEPYTDVARKAFHNAHVPISRLPDEVLAIIFACNPPSDPYPWLTIRDSDRTWMHVTQVCHRWREVALSFPSLWSNIVFRWPQWTTMMLQRAKMAPLSIDAVLHQDSKGVVYHGLLAAMNFVSRFRHLTLIGPRWHDEDSRLLVSALTIHPAPLLRSLQIRGAGTLWLDLPDDVFQGKAPRLKELTIKWCNFNWTSPLFHNQLTHLSLGPILSDRRPVMDTLLDLLNNMPSLQELRLLRILPRSGFVNVTPLPALTRPAVNLYFLKYIEIESVVQDCVDFFRRITFPVTARAKLTMKHDSDELDCLPSIISMVALTSMLASDIAECAGCKSVCKSPLPVRSLRIRHLGGAGLRVQVGEGAFSFYDCNSWVWNWSPYYDLSLTLRYHPTDVAKVFVLGMCHALPLQELETLSIEGEFSFGTEQWLYAFGHLPRLRDLRISGMPLYGFADTFKELNGQVLDFKTLTAPQKPVEIPVAPFMPALQNIVFEMVDFMGSHELHHCLLDGLKLRKEYNNGERALMRILVECCDITENQMQQFVEYVTHGTVWDRQKDGLRAFWKDEGLYDGLQWVPETNEPEDAIEEGEDDMEILSDA